MNMHFLVWVFLVAATQMWAIVDIAPVEVGSKPGLSGNVAGSYVSKSGNTEKDEYDFSGKVQYDSNQSYLTFFQASYERTETYGLKTEDQKYTHLRYLHKLNEETLYGELFFQGKENVFKGIDRRLLIGGGIRWRFLSDAEWGKFYLGLGAFHENIDYTVSPTAPAGTVAEADESKARLNSYLAYTHTVSDSAEVNLVGYYQPSFEESGDHYTSFMAELEVHVVYELYLSFIYEIDYDSRPPAGVKKQDRMTKTSLIWKF